MNCFPLFSYSFFTILYIILFSFLFTPKLENIVIIFLFIVTFIGGYNLVSDLKKREVYFEFQPIIDVFEDGSGLDLLKLLLFSPFTTVFIFIVLIMALAGYFMKRPEANVSYIVFLSILLFITNMIQIGISVKDIKLAYVLILPIIMILLSFIFLLIGIYNIYKYSTGITDPIPYSQLDDSHQLYYKIGLIIEISIIIIFLTYFILFYEKGDKDMQYQLYSIILLLYILSGSIVYISSNVLQKKFLGNVS